MVLPFRVLRPLTLHHSNLNGLLGFFLLPLPTYSVVASPTHSPGFMWAALAVGILIVCVLLVGIGIICFQNKWLIGTV
jgi:hypothetical protein